MPDHHPSTTLGVALVEGRGRGGAGFPTGLKWSFLPPVDGGPRYLVVNADESEPGTCKDIPLMMAAPHFLIEGVAITSYAIGCHHAFIYLRGEVVHVYRRLLRAVEEAYAKGYLGKDILAGFKNLAGGELVAYTELLTESRNEAIGRMVHQAQQMGANGVVNVRFTTSSVAAGAAELYAYGTAVVLEQA